MSSHHFVIEGQEPALFILDLVPPQIVMPLLEWSPLVLVSGSIVHEVIDWGVKVDAVLYNPGAVPGLEKLNGVQGHITLIPQLPDESDLTSGIAFLLNRKEKAVNIIVSSPLDHFSKAAGFNHIQISFITDRQKWIKPVRLSFEKWLPADAVLEIWPIERMGHMHTHNVVNTGSGFQVVSAGIVRVSSENWFWIGESLE